MTQAMPWVFATLAALALGAAVVAFWQSVRAVFGLVDTEGARGEDELGLDLDLVARKQALLEGLRDLDFDHEAGKLSDEDHRAERERIRTELKDVLRAVDAAVGPHRDAAEALVAAAEAKATAEPGTAPDDAPSAPAAPAPIETVTSRSDADAFRRVCPNCATENDADATFCKRCAAKLPTEVAV